MSAEPLRHYFAAPEDHPTRDRCARRGCALPLSDPVHLEPGDHDAMLRAINASAPPAPHAQPQHGARYTFGTTAAGTTTVTIGDSTGTTWGDSSPRAPREAG
jgi:hypothetical protein